MRLFLTTLHDLIRQYMLVSATAAFITGGAVARYLALPESILQQLIPAVLLLFVLTFFCRTRPAAMGLLVASFVLTGFVHTGFALLPPASPDHLYSLIRDRTKATLTGTVIRMPEYDGRKTSFELAADSILVHRDGANTGVQKPVRGRIRLSLESALPENITAGTQLMVLAKVNRIYNYRTPGVFDYRLHMADRSIYVSGRIDSAAAILPFTDRPAKPMAAIRYLPERVRQHIADFLDTSLAPEIAGIYKALLIGSRTGIDEQTLEQFKASGCMHLLAISGLHMGLLGLMLLFAFTWLMKRSTYLLLHCHVPTLAMLLTLVPLVCYAWIAGMNTPVLRALIMSVLFLVGVVLQRQRSILPILAAAAFILLLFRPLALFTVSFQLSFASVLAIAVLYPRLLNLLEKNGGEYNRIFRYGATALLVSIAATLGSLPFMLYHFNRFSVIGPVMNLLVEPFLCFWALPAGLLAAPCIFVAPDIARLLLQIGSMGILAADRITLIGSSIPFASFWTVTPDPLQMVVYFLLFGMLLLRPKSLRNRAVLLSAWILLAASFLHGQWFYVPASTTRVSFLDVGQGSATFIRLPNGGTALVDGGSKSSPSYDIGERVIGPFLWKQKVWRLDDVVVTHPDSDHYNGLNFIIRRFRPQRLWINGDGKDERPFSELLQTATELGIQIVEPTPGQSLPHTEDVRISFVNGASTASPASPGAQGRAQLTVNDRSLVVRLTHGAVSFLFPGDISIQAEEVLLREGKNVRADILLAAHHGSKGSNSRSFIAAVDPGTIVVSSGSGVRGPYLDSGHLQDWTTEGRTVLATARHGTVAIATDGKSIFIQ